jgi:hypothetical protein
MTVVVESVVANEDGTFTGVLVREGVRVQCDGIAWWDDCDGELLEELFAEWAMFADEGEEGYMFL